MGETPLVLVHAVRAAVSAVSCWVCLLRKGISAESRKTCSPQVTAALHDQQRPSGMVVGEVEDRAKQLHRTEGLACQCACAVHRARKVIGAAAVLP